VASFRLAPGFRQFEAYEATAGFDSNYDSDPIISHEAAIIEDEEETATYCPPVNPWLEGGTQCTPTEVSIDMNKPVPLQPTVHGIPMVDPEEDRAASDASLLLQYHRQFGHISFTKLKHMAKLGVIPKRLAKCPTPVCSACMYAKATRKAWRSKTPSQEQPINITSPGELVSVDQLVSPTVGFIAQMTGKLTKKRYKYATVFVDQASKLGYVYFQKTSTVEETLEAKAAFQQYASDKHITIKAYHADNGIFRANKWQLACKHER
jgi:hypothetical protein